MFIYIILPFIYLFLRWYYYYGEGTTESMLWKIAKPHSPEFSATYHKFREYVENMGARLLLVVFAFVTWKWLGLVLWIGVELSGICWYELRFRHIKYGDWKHVKDGTYKIPFFGKIIELDYPTAGMMVFIGLIGFIIFSVAVRIMTL